MISEIKTKGTVERIIQYKDGKIEKSVIENTVLTTGQMALAASLANQFGGQYNYFISNMIFGNGGTTASNIPKFVPNYQTGLFGTTVANPYVVAVINPQIPTQVIFTSVLGYNTANGQILNEMALVMNNGQFYSMTTFPNLTKNSNMSITWTWTNSFL
jgi:hypothetical protein